MTIKRNAADSDYICEKCIDGFKLSSGTCISCKKFLSTETFANCAKVTEITEGADEATAAAAAACAEGYWLNAAKKCVACTTGCKKCEKNADADTEKCTEVTSNEYYIDVLNTVYKCDLSSSPGKKTAPSTALTAAPECKTCTFTAGSELTCVTAYAIKSTYATFTASTAVFSGSKTDSNVVVASGCTKFNYDSDGSLRGRALAAITWCTECADTHALKTTYTLAADMAAGVPVSATCETRVTNDASKGCKKYKWSTEGSALRGRALAVTITFKCTECISDYFISGNTCVTITDC